MEQKLSEVVNRLATIAIEEFDGLEADDRESYLRDCEKAIKVFWNFAKESFGEANSAYLSGVYERALSGMLKQFSIQGEHKIVFEYAFMLFYLGHIRSSIESYVSL